MISEVFLRRKAENEKYLREELAKTSLMFEDVLSYVDEFCLIDWFRRVGSISDTAGVGEDQIPILIKRPRKSTNYNQVMNL